MPHSSPMASAGAGVCLIILYACGGGGGDVTAPADPMHPTVTLTRPAPEAVVTGSVVLAVLVRNDPTLVGVQFKVDWEDFGAEDTEAPYQQTWNTLAAKNGPHLIAAVARDAAGNIEASETIVVTVSNAGS